MLFIRKHRLIVIGIIEGMIGGYFYWRQIGCASGTCYITSNSVHSTLYGGLMGGLLLSLFKNEKTNNHAR
jgi:hypothetical protein